jgi:cation:H+ antiporter
MPVLAHVGLFVLGLLVLAAGAESFIRGAVRVARKFGVSPFVIGLTLVGFGTSAPELVVNLSAAFNGKPDIAVGNVVGSNIANVGLILGLAAVVRTLTAHMRLLKVETPLVLAASVAVWVMALDGDLGRFDAAILLAGFAGIMAFIARTARKEPPAVKQEIGKAVPKPERMAVSVLFLLVGLGGLVGGAELMVRSAVAVATSWGVSEAVIGLTVVAVGTSLPELASSVAAAYRGQSDIAVGNVVGSNLFNLLLILGATAAITPLPVDPVLLRFDLPAMVGFAVLLLLVLVNGLKVYRWEGAVLLLAYAGFIGWAVVRTGASG